MDVGLYYKYNVQTATSDQINAHCRLSFLISALIFLHGVLILLSIIVDGLFHFHAVDGVHVEDRNILI